MHHPVFIVPKPGTDIVLFRTTPIPGRCEALYWDPRDGTFDVYPVSEECAKAHVRGPDNPKPSRWNAFALYCEIFVVIDDTCGLVWVGDRDRKLPWRIRGEGRQERFLEGLVAFGGYDHTTIEVATDERTRA